MLLKLGVFCVDSATVARHAFWMSNNVYKWWDFMVLFTFEVKLQPVDSMKTMTGEQWRIVRIILKSTMMTLLLR